jgi:signal transduction histidine kinase
MKRLWVRLSLLISGLLVTAILATTIFTLVFDHDRRSPRPGQPPRDTGPTILGVSQDVGGQILLVGLIGIAVGVVVSRTVSAPITQLAAAARRIGTGELTTRIDIGGSQELVEVAQAFNTMASDLQQAEQLRANLMADVSHELRTPLTALEGNLRAALDRVYALDEAEIADLYSQTRHLIRLVNDLRELALADAHQLPLRLEPTDLATLVDETLRVFAPLAEEQGVQLTQNLDPLPVVNVDALRIRQVVHNLLANALRYTPDGGRVTVSGRVDREMVILSVEDTGIGLEADQLAHVFDRFYRGDVSRSRDMGGTGLGLAIVKAIVESHGGRMRSESAGMGQGATFSFALPRRGVAALPPGSFHSAPVVEQLRA